MHSTLKMLSSKYRDKGLVPPACLPQAALPLRCVRGQRPDATRRHTSVQKTRGTRAWTGLANAVCVDDSWTSQIEHGETCSPAEATEGHHACVHAVFGGLPLADPGITTEPRGLTEAQSRVAHLFTIAAALDGGDGDEDTDTGTDTAIPGDDDDNDIASLASHYSTSLQHSNLQSRPLAVLGLLAVFDVSMAGWSLNMSSKIVACALKSLPIPSPSSEQFMSGVPWFSHFHQRYSWSTGCRRLHVHEGESSAAAAKVHPHVCSLQL